MFPGAVSIPAVWRFSGFSDQLRKLEEVRLVLVESPFCYRDAVGLLGQEEVAFGRAFSGVSLRELVIRGIDFDHQVARTLPDAYARNAVVTDARRQPTVGFVHGRTRFDHE